MGVHRFSLPVASAVLVVCSIAALLMLSTSAGAKGNTVRIVVSGPDLLEPVEITDPDAVRGNADVYRATFIDVGQGAIDDVPSTPVPPYEIKFYVAYGPDDVRMKYVVYYAWDRAQRKARVYFPGRSDAWWQHNAFTVLLPYEGKWYYANDRWGRAVHEAILEHTDPRHLEVAYAQDFALQVGPPIAVMPQPGTDRVKKSTDTLFVVRPVGCADPAAARMAGTADGVVNGVRRRVTLTLEPLPTPGVRAVPRGWAEEGTWVVHVVGTCDGRTAGALVTLGPKDTYRREAVVPVTGVPTPAQVGAALRAATGR